MTKGKKCAVVFATDAKPDDLNRMGYSMRALDRFMAAPHDTFVLTESKSVRFDGGGGVAIADPTPVLTGVGIRPSGWGRTHWPFAVMYRLAIPLMPEFSGYDRAVYLDTDTLAFSGVDGFMAFDMKGHEVVGAPEIIGNRYDDRGADASSVLPPEGVGAMRSWLWGATPLSYKSYMNAGVLLLDLSKIRENGIDWYVRRLTWAWPRLRVGEGFRCRDQDFVNFMMDSATLLSSRYNALFPDQPNGATIVHYVGDSKPKMLWEVRKRYGGDPYNPETGVVTVSPTVGMRLSVEELFEHSFVVSLPESEGRRNAFFNDLHDRNHVDVRDPRVFFGVRVEPGPAPAFGLAGLGGETHAFGCGLSHLAIVCAAKALGWPSVLVFEDDARFADAEGRSLLASLVSSVPACSKLVKLGFSPSQDGADPFHPRSFPNLVEGDVTWGAHAYVMFKDWYDTAIDILTRSSVTPDTDVMNLLYVPDRLKGVASGLYHTAVNVFDQRPQDTSPKVSGWVSRPDMSGEELDETAERLSNNWPYFSFGPDGVRYSRGTIPRDGNAEEGDFYMNVFCLVRVARALGLRFVRARGGGKTYTIPGGAFDTVAPFAVDAQTPRAADALAQFLDGGDNDTNDREETQA